MTDYCKHHVDTDETCDECIGEDPEALMELVRGLQRRVKTLEDQLSAMRQELEDNGSLSS